MISGAATIRICSWKKVRDNNESCFFSIYFYSSAQVILYRQLDEYCFDILLGAGHRQPDCLLVKLNLHWHASFVYLRLPAGWGRKKYLVHYPTRYQWGNYSPTAASSVSISAFLVWWKAFMTGICWTSGPLGCASPSEAKTVRLFSFRQLPPWSRPFLSYHSFPLSNQWTHTEYNRLHPHLQIAASTTQPLELKSQIRNWIWGFLAEVPRQGLSLC